MSTQTASPSPDLIPADCRTAALGDLCEFVLDGTHGSPERSPAGIPLLSAKNVYESKLHFDEFDCVTLTEYNAGESPSGRATSC